MFFDLNLGVDGLEDQSRRQVVAMAMQLGYSGVAANHMFTGVMADTDRCKIRALDLQTVVAAAPGVAEGARFHQDVLGVPPGRPFRQFTRITVVVDTSAQANALNSANPVLKTYDIVAVRPLNQKAFSQACSQLEVDLISLDFSQKLPFRLKNQMVKAAVERGIYFEVSYGRSLFDPKARRELFANAQMLQAASCGRNIILSSGARSAMELRGPNDVANLSTLFGLSLESAKAAVSRNCKSVLLHGVARKNTYKAAIHIEPATVRMNNNAFNVPLDWDALSLGGASADFIPVKETKMALPVEEFTTPRSTKKITTESFESFLFGGSAEGDSTSAELDRKSDTGGSLVDTLQETTFTGGRSLDDLRVNNSLGKSPLLGSINGLLISTNLNPARDEQHSLRPASKESASFIPFQALGKRKPAGDMNNAACKVEKVVNNKAKLGKQNQERDAINAASNTEKGGNSKAKRRKRKR